MRKFSRFFVSLFLVLGTAVFSSCINDAYSAQDFEVSITGEQLAAMMESSREIVTLDDSQIDFKLIITLVVNNRNFDQRIFRSNLDDARKTGFDVSFNRVPVGSKAKVKVELVTFQGEKVYAESNTIKVTKKPQELTLKIGPFTVNPVISSDVVLFNKNGENYSYYQFGDEIQNILLTDNSTKKADGLSVVYTFDSNGEIYYAYVKENENGYGWYHYSIKIKTPNGTELALLENLYKSGNYSAPIISIRTDHKNNDCLYLYYYFDNTKHLVRFPNLSGSSPSTSNMKEIVIDDNYKNMYFENFEVNDEVLYILNKNKGFDISLVSTFIEAQGDSYFLSDSRQITPLGLRNLYGKDDSTSLSVHVRDRNSGPKEFPIPEWTDVYLNEPDITVSDMLYLDGYIYLVTKQENLILTNSSNQVKMGGYERGALIKVSKEGDDIQICGLNTSTFDLNNKNLYANSNKTGTFSDSETFGDVYHRFHSLIDDSSESVFVSPQKIVAIKPKKLVILDSGVAFYTDNDVLSFKKTNRLVEVDLFDFVIAGRNSNIGNVYFPQNVSSIAIKTIDVSDDSSCRTLTFDAVTYKTEGMSHIIYEDNN